MEKKYRPINCGFYDELELLALRKTVATIVFLNSENKEETVEDVITNLIAKDKEEFLELKKGNRIRLDQLISVNDKILGNYC